MDNCLLNNGDSFDYLISEMESVFKSQEDAFKCHLMKVQEDNVNMKQILSKLCRAVKCVQEKQKSENSYIEMYKKAIEERDEYKLKAHSQACLIMKMEKQLSGINPCDIENVLNCSNNASYLDIEIDFLHKENESLRNELKTLQNQLRDQHELWEEVQAYRAENMVLKEENIGKQVKILELTVRFDSKLKELETSYENSVLSALKDLEKCGNELVKLNIFNNDIERDLACVFKKIDEIQLKLNGKILDHGYVQNHEVPSTPSCEEYSETPLGETENELPIAEEFQHKPAKSEHMKDSEDVKEKEMLADEIPATKGFHNVPANIEQVKESENMEMKEHTEIFPVSCGYPDGNVSSEQSEVDQDVCLKNNVLQSTTLTVEEETKKWSPCNDLKRNLEKHKTVSSTDEECESPCKMMEISDCEDDGDSDEEETEMCILL